MRMAAAKPYQRLRPGPGQARDDVIASQRARLRRAMIELAGREGAEAVTVRRLTKLARVSTGAFYASYQGTDDCLLRTYEELMAGLIRKVATTRSVELEPGRQVEVTLRALAKELRADRDAARFALIEIYGGGPAALAAVAGEERRLQSTLGACLDRRGKRVPEAMTAAIVAASLHCFRILLDDDAPADPRATIDALAGWASDVVEGREDYSVAGLGVGDASAEEPAAKGVDSGPGGRQEEEMIMSAVLRLASPDGFFGLSAGKVSSAAGLPAARLRRHFSDLTDAYLAAVRRTCRSIFAELTAGADRDRPSRGSVRSALRQAWRRAASDPAGARLTFGGIVEPGIAGLTCREALISELAVACGAGSAPADAVDPVREEARAAAIWTAFARAGSQPVKPAKAPRGGAPRTGAGSGLRALPSSSGAR